MMSGDDKPHLLLLPGLLNDARLWQHQVSSLDDVAVPVVGDLTRADSMALLANQTLAQVPAERFVLAGLSMGGYVALEIMRQAPDRIRGLALVDTMARPDSQEATENRYRLMSLAEQDFSKVIETLMSRFVHPDRLNDRDITETIEAMAHDAGREVFLRQQRAIIDRLDSRPFLPGIQCPTLVLCGAQDAIAPVEIHQEMAGAIPRARLQVIEHCGHLAPVEQPQAVTDALRQWLTAEVI